MNIFVFVFVLLDSHSSNGLSVFQTMYVTVSICM